MNPKLHSLAALPLLLLLATSCGSGTTEVDAGTRSTWTRSADPRLLEARAALEAGRPSAAESLLASLGPAAGVEGPLCSARVFLTQGMVVAAMKEVERARELAPEDPRVFATMAEILALAGRGGDAEDEIARGAVFGPRSLDLERARAFLDLTRPGQGPLALARLEAALAADPGLPYCNWPMAQAHLLTGRAALGAGDAQLAADQARLALGREPDLATAEELLGSALASLEDFAGALEALERAQDLGLDVAPQMAEVHMRAGMAARLLKRPDLAEEHYLGARELGMSASELGSGADFLRQRAHTAFETGQAAALRDDFEAAAAGYARAVILDPTGALALEAKDGQAAARFRLEDYAGAVLLWGEVLEVEWSRPDGIESRTHLNIARAEVLSGDYEGARKILEGALERFPEGPAAAETQELLGRVPRP